MSLPSVYVRHKKLGLLLGMPHVGTPSPAAGYREMKDKRLNVTTWVEGRRKTRRLMMYSKEQRENLATWGNIKSIGLAPYSSAKVE